MTGYFSPSRPNSRPKSCAACAKSPADLFSVDLAGDGDRDWMCLSCAPLWVRLAERALAGSQTSVMGA